MKKQNYISKLATIKEEVKLESPVKLYGTARVNKGCSIGAFTYIESRTTLFPKTTIGRYCSIGKNNQIGVIAHPTQWLSTSPIQYNMTYHFPDYATNFPQKKFERPMETIIENDVWIGSMVLVKRGVTIGDGAIIAAGAAVMQDIPPYAIVGGVPAKIIRYRFSEEIIQKLLALKWWQLPYTALAGIDFDDIDEAIGQLEAKKELLLKSKPKRCWVCNESSKSKLITVDELEKYLKKGWIKGKIYKVTKTTKKIAEKNPKKPMENKPILRNGGKKKKPDKKETINELQKSINESMKRSKDSKPKMSIETLQEIISSQLLEADVPTIVIDDIFKHNKNMYRDYDEDEHEDQVILNHKISALIEIISADKLYIENKRISSRAHKKISNVLKSKQ